jgi:hypothetical protein
MFARIPNVMMGKSFGTNMTNASGLWSQDKVKPVMTATTMTTRMSENQESPLSWSKVDQAKVTAMTKVLKP